MKLSKKQIGIYFIFVLALLIGLWGEGKLWRCYIHPERTATIIGYVQPYKVIELNKHIVNYVDEEGNTLSVVTYTETISTATFTTTFSTKTIIEFEETITIIYIGIGGG